MNKIMMAGVTYMTVTDYSETYGVPKPTVYHYLRNGKLKSKKMFGKNFVEVPA